MAQKTTFEEVFGFAQRREGDQHARVLVEGVRFRMRDTRIRYTKRGDAARFQCTIRCQGIRLNTSHTRVF